MKKTMVMFLALQGAWIPAFGDSREQVVPLRNWALVEKLDPGRMIELSGKSGSKLQGRFVRLDSRAICMSSEGRDLEYPRADVAEVYALIRDTSKDGALRGLVIGVAVSLPLSLAAGSGGESTKAMCLHFLSAEQCFAERSEPWSATSETGTPRTASCSIAPVETRFQSPLVHVVMKGANRRRDSRR